MANTTWHTFRIRLMNDGLHGCHRDRGDHRNQHDDGVGGVVEHAQAKGHGGDDDFERAAGVEARAQGGSGPPRLTGGDAAHVGAHELGHYGNDEHNARPEQRLPVVEQTQVDTKPRGREEDGGKEHVGQRLEMMQDLGVLESRPIEHDPGDEGAEHRFDLYGAMVNLADAWSDSLPGGPLRLPSSMSDAFLAVARLAAAEVFE